MVKRGAGNVTLSTMKVLATSALRLAARGPVNQQWKSIPRQFHLQAALSTAVLARSRSLNLNSVVTRSSRSFSDDSHDDFAPKRKSVGDVDEAVKMIEEHVKSNRVMLYMKGNPSMPMCGFSAKVVQILQTEGVDFASVNVLDYPTVREGVKKYSDWPTIPQLYVDAEFVGGCDIITSMHESGELKELLNVNAEE
ncbi:hypothetical protein MPSEU_001060300 [Mayamaea pseudoterrestris]|nr:hypothetical protein MPSEU_001060300 [Mayamaea pseudoterrestris]